MSDRVVLRLGTLVPVAFAYILALPRSSSPTGDSS